MNTKAIAILEVVTSPIDSSVRSLGAGQILSLGRKGGSSVYCLSGALWVTREGSPADIVVRAGETRAIPGKGRLVISAFEDSRLWVA